MIEDVDVALMTEKNDTQDRMLATLNADPIESTDPIEPMERIEPADPIDRIEPVDPMDRIEPEPGAFVRAIPPS
jgi:hypothetical protein